MKLPADDTQVETDHILSLHRKPGLLRRDNRVVYAPTNTDYTASSNDPTGTGEGSQKPGERKPETY